MLRQTAFLSISLLAALPAFAASRDISIATETRTEKRVALVIGNAAYVDAPLKNPVNDARAMVETLRALGFDVIARENATQAQMQRAVLEFGEKLSAGAVGLVYYSGHGLQVGGKNYLVPVDASGFMTCTRVQFLDMGGVTGLSLTSLGLQTAAGQYGALSRVVVHWPWGLPSTQLHVQVAQAWPASKPAARTTPNAKALKRKMPMAQSTMGIWA